MAAPDAILLVVLSLLISLTSWIGVRLYQSVNDELLPQLRTLNSKIYGQDRDGHDSGLVGDIEELKTTVEEASEERQQEHERVGNRLDRLQTSLNGVRENQQHITDSLREADSVDFDVQITNDGEE